MLSSCKPVQLFVNMQIERYGKRKVLHMMRTAILGNLRYLLFKVYTYHIYDGKYMYMYELSKNIIQELGSSIYYLPLI